MMMTWFASILLLLMINVVHGDPLVINIRQEIEDTCCNDCSGCHNVGEKCGSELDGCCRDDGCQDDEHPIDGNGCCHGPDCVCCAPNEVCNPPCENGGTCTGNNTCICPEPYYGPTCNETMGDFGGGCAHPNSRCGVEGIGTCRPMECEPGEESIGDCNGDDCLCCAPKPECDPPCENGGVCCAPDTCCCDPPWTGPTCEEAICDPPCENGGTCIDPNICICTNVTDGYRCETHCPREEIIADGDGFGFHYCVKTYQEAYDFCEKHGWILATPNEQFEEFDRRMPPRDEFWLDVLPNSSTNKTNIWYWQSSPLELTTTIQWQEDYIPFTPPFCASIYRSYDLAGNICTRKWYFVCESPDFQDNVSYGNFAAAWKQSSPDQRQSDRKLLRIRG